MSDTALAIGFGAIILAFIIVKAIEWALEARQRRAAWEAWQATRPAPRLHENCRSALLADPTPLNAGVDVSAFFTDSDLGLIADSLNPRAPRSYFHPNEGISNDGCKSD